MQQTRNRISSGARNDGYLSTLKLSLEIREDHVATAKPYRRSSPPSAPRTSARPTELPIEPPRDLPSSAAMPPATWLVTVRATFRAMT